VVEEEEGAVEHGEADINLTRSPRVHSDVILCKITLPPPIATTLVGLSVPINRIVILYVYNCHCRSDVGRGSVLNATFSKLSLMYRFLFLRNKGQKVERANTMI